MQSVATRMNERNQQMRQGSKEAETTRTGTASQESVVGDMSWQATWNIRSHAEIVGDEMGVN